MFSAALSPAKNRVRTKTQKQNTQENGLAHAEGQLLFSC